MSEIVLENHSLTKYYGSALTVGHLDLRILHGYICGFVSRNGERENTT